jgi:hypothetical protein
LPSTRYQIEDQDTVLTHLRGWEVALSFLYVSA